MYEKVVAEARTRMKKTIEDLQRELASIRTGRASVHVLDQIQVDYYGTLTPLNQMATLHAPEPQLLTVQPWDASQIGNIEKAILTSDLGLNPNNDGKIIRIPIPSLTQERRQELAKQIGRIAEDHRTAVRNIRRDCNDQLKKALKDKDISEDEEHLGLEEVQSVTDEFVEEINKRSEAKEKEILEV
ncbi:MAG TPA: ribosome recycling factor [Acidobacteriota bacterium]|nr:ribosome recycling factor [Acidobacteriota bacterium]